eukprot:6176354-Pleurochrysis_carterae.AAC.3
MGVRRCEQPYVRVLAYARQVTRVRPPRAFRAYADAARVRARAHLRARSCACFNLGLHLERVSAYVCLHECALRRRWSSRGTHTRAVLVRAFAMGRAMPERERASAHENNCAPRQSAAACVTSACKLE